MPSSLFGGSSHGSDRSKLRFLIEIVSCRDLLPADDTGKSDPYVKIKIGNKFIHQTQHATQDLNPKFTRKMDSLFAFKTAEEELIDAGGLHLRIKDWDMIGSDDDLGDAFISAEDLCGMSGDVVELKIEPPKSRKKEKAGFISFRCRRASDSDWKKYGPSKAKKFLGLNEKVAQVKAYKSHIKDQGKQLADSAIQNVKTRSSSNRSSSNNLSSQEFNSVELNDNESIHDKQEQPSADASSKTKSINDDSNHDDNSASTSKSQQDITSSGVKSNTNTMDFFSKKKNKKSRNGNDTQQYNETSGKQSTAAKASADENLVVTPENSISTKTKTTTQGGSQEVKRSTEASSASVSEISEDSDHGSPNKKRISTITMPGPQKLPEDMQPKEKLKFLIEISSCKDLLMADGESQEAPLPFVKVRIGDRFIHQTQHGTQDVNPTFTRKDHSLFAFKCTAKELFNAGGVQFRIKNWHMVGNNDKLGIAFIPADDLCTMSGDVVEYAITPPQNRKNEQAGYISFRCRRASDEDWKQYGPSKEAKLVAALGVDEKVAKVNAYKSHIKDTGKNIAHSAIHRSDKSEEGSEEGSYNSSDKWDDDEMSSDFMTEFLEDPDGHDGKTMTSQKLPEHMKPKQRLRFLIEVMSCRDLMSAGETGIPDPFVKVKIGDRFIHQTNNITQDRNPTFTTKTNSIFVMKSYAKDFFKAGGLRFAVKHWNVVGHNPDLGDVCIPADVLCSLTGDVIERKIIPPEDRKDEHAGYLSFWCRRATDEDLKKYGRKHNMRGNVSRVGSKLGLNEKMAKVKAYKTHVKNTGKVLTKISEDTNDLYGKKNEMSIEEIEEKSGGRKLGDMLKLKIEIMNARSLIGDEETCKPYVKIRNGNDKDVIHKTKSRRTATVNPDWEQRHDSTFCLSVSVREIFDSCGLMLMVKDSNSHDDLGDVEVTAETLCDMSGEPIIYKITPPEEHEYPYAGKLSICISSATESEMKEFKPTSKGGGNKNIAEKVVGGVKGAAGTAVGGVAMVGKVGVGSVAVVSGAVGTTVGSGVSTVTKKIIKEEKDDDSSEEESEEESSDDESSHEPPEPIAFDSVPHWFVPATPPFLPAENCKVTIHGDDVREARELLERAFELAVELDPTIRWVEMYGLKLSESADDYRLTQAIVNNPSIVKLCLYDLSLLSRSDVYGSPPLFESLTTMSSLVELEIRMKGKEKLPNSFFNDFFESQHIQSVVLWNVIFDSKQLENLGNKLRDADTSVKLSRLEMWCCECDSNGDGDNGNRFAAFSEQVLQGNVPIQNLVLSHVGISGNDCTIIGEALAKSSTIENLALINVIDAQTPEFAIAASQMYTVGLKSLKITHEELDHDACIDFYDKLYQNWRKQRQNATSTRMVGVLKALTFFS